MGSGDIGLSVPPGGIMPADRFFMFSRRPMVFRSRLYWTAPEAYPRPRTWPMIVLPGLLTMVGFYTVPVSSTPYSGKPTNAGCCPQATSAKHATASSERNRFMV